ncbi:rod shape-determining protein MreD [Sphingobium sufflavum]|uniref:rod shape-determining protein MreD n=1 Tax=Sphingobium sufflavum TaxID=1129547 RepID=UPI001F2B08BF|nr:rod shape-determining protein MreD [Sphingobium sufflavum]MCE7796036.1 rod shape-determining protein MreD [Sphingobium sufflavum]
MKSRYARMSQSRSPLRIRATPVITVMLGSLLPAMIPVVSLSPTTPPLGLMLLLAWRLLRPELWPLWIGLPLGFFDDIATGHPVGTAMCLWTLALVVIDSISVRLIWRDYAQDWLIASIAIIAILAMSWLLMHLAPGGGGGPLDRLWPQALLSIMSFPLVARLCARLDRWRLP